MSHPAGTHGIATPLPGMASPAPWLQTAMSHQSVMCHQSPTVGHEATVNYIILFNMDSTTYIAAVVHVRSSHEAPNGMTHLLEYQSGTEGQEWVRLDEQQKLLHDGYGHSAVSYSIQAP